MSAEKQKQWASFVISQYKKIQATRKEIKNTIATEQAKYKIKLKTLIWDLEPYHITIKELDEGMISEVKQLITPKEA